MSLQKSWLKIASCHVCHLVFSWGHLVHRGFVEIDSSPFSNSCGRPGFSPRSHVPWGLTVSGSVLALSSGFLWTVRLPHIPPPAMPFSPAATWCGKQTLCLVVCIAESSEGLEQLKCFKWRIHSPYLVLLSLSPSLYLGPPSIPKLLIKVCSHTKKVHCQEKL